MLPYTDAKWVTYVDPNYGNVASGNRPNDVPKWIGNVWTSYSHVAGLPLTLGGGVRYVGQRYGDSANQLSLDSYVLANVYATYDLTDKVAVTVRVDNLFDKAYVQWADLYYPGEVILGRPRYFETSVRAKF